MTDWQELDKYRDRVAELEAELETVKSALGKSGLCVTDLHQAIERVKACPTRVGPFTAKAGEEYILPISLKEALEQEDE